MARSTALILLLLCATGVGWAALEWRAQRIVEAPVLPMTFAHRDHVQQDCLGCHHEFTDDSGSGLCIACHKQRPELALRIETDFHDLCRDCHVRTQQLGRKTGPTRPCEGCHTADDEP